MERFLTLIARLAVAAVPAALVACGGGAGDSVSGNQPPVASITSPAAGSTFRAGDTLTFAGSATDAEDGVLAATNLTWWAELHHDNHTHPFRQQSTGGSGTATIPTRGETADNIFYRFHLRATDSAGASHEVTRDVLPRKAQITLATAPAGLTLTLDGQPVTTPITFTGVVGIERDLVASAQNFNTRRYQFSHWSDGGAAAHTIATPATDTTYVATFNDVGPAVNNPPTVAMTAPASGSTVAAGVPTLLTATAADSDDSVTGVEFFDNGVKIGATDTAAPYSVSWTPTVAGARTLTARATDNFGLSATSAAVNVTVSTPSGDIQPPVATLSSPANLASGLTGTLSVTVNATDNVGVTAIEIQVDGQPVGSTGSGATHSVNVDTTAYASGQHVVRARATDAAGNRSAWVTATVSFGGSRTQPAGFTRNESWITGLSNATAFTQTPDGRLLVAQQGGALRVVKDGVLLAQPMLSVTAVDSNGERGLIGVTVHPNFASNGWVYVYHTTTENGTHNRISRFTATGDTAGNAVVLVDLPGLSSATNHNGGAMRFGTDGKLYVGVGDNSDGSHSPSLTSVFGKILRFNDDGSIPNDNPICGTAGVQNCAIWARGLRNPFTIAVQPGSGRIHINDVGAASWEEVNVGAPAANYGWPSTEGPTSAAGITAPLFAYAHDPSNPPGSGPGGFFTGCGVIGGAFYPDSGPFPAAYRGSYFFTDLCSGSVARLDLANGNAAYAFGQVDAFLPVGMLVGLDGALYVLRQSNIVRFSAP